MNIIYKYIIIVFIIVVFAGVTGFTEGKPAVSPSTGTIIETQRVSHYLYLLVNVEGEKFWISTIAKYLPDDIAAGDTIEYTGGMLIQGFNSVAMQKSFNTMLLVSKIKVVRQQ